jgi:hypothetical protein
MGYADTRTPCPSGPGLGPRVATEAAFPGDGAEKSTDQSRKEKVRAHSDPRASGSLLHAEFEDGSVRDFDLLTLDFYDLLKQEGRLNQATLDPGGYGISWDDEHDVSERTPSLPSPLRKWRVEKASNHPRSFQPTQLNFVFFQNLSHHE